MPSARNASSVAREASAVPRTVSPSTTPWSANACMVAKGIVLTVPRVTNPVTYSVSGYAGSLTPVEAHSRRCGRAPRSASSPNRPAGSNTSS